MINLSTVTKALQEQLNNNVGVKNFIKNEVVRGEMVNVDPNQVPWVGVYRGKVNYFPRTLGSMNNWEAEPSVRVIVQNTDLRSAAACEEELEEYVQAILNAVITDTTIGGTVDIIKDFNVEVGYLETDRNSIYFQGAVITFNLEVATS